MKRGVTPLGLRVVACGVDTASVAWNPRPDDDEWWKMIAGRLRAGLVDHKAEMPVLGVPQRACLMCRSKGGGYVSRQPVMGGKLMVWPASRLIAVEGRLACLERRKADAEGLAPPRLLKSAARRSASYLRWLGLLDGGERCFVRRLDLATDLRFVDRSAGAAFLDAFYPALPPEGHKLNGWVAVHGAETINLFRFRGKRRELVGRIYDRGDKTGSWPHGELTRFERQLRWQGAARPPLEQAARASWTQQALGWLTELRTRTPQPVMIDDQERLLRLIENGVIKQQTGLRLLGSLTVIQHRDLVQWWKARGKNGAAVRRKHHAELQRLGLLIPPAEVLVPGLDAVLSLGRAGWRGLGANSTLTGADSGAGSRAAKRHNTLQPVFDGSENMVGLVEVPLIVGS
jgi:hypothetical protein